MIAIGLLDAGGPPTYPDRHSCGAQVPHRIAIGTAILLLYAGLVRAGEDPEKPSVELSLPAKRMLLDPGKKVSVTITIRDSQGRGLEGQSPDLAASVGTLGNLRELGKGRYRATYTLSQHRHPHSAILAAKLPSAPPGWTVLRLGSKTKLPVKTEKPNVMVTLTIGGRSYGPVQTDDWGKVKVPVEIWPGEREGQAVAKDEFGNSTTRRVQIPVPPTSVSLGFAAKSMLVADGKDSSELYFIVVTPDGRPARRASFLAQRKLGELSKAKRLLPGLYQFTYTAPKGLTARQTRLTIAVRPNPEENRQTFSFRLTAGRPEQIQASAMPAILPADGRSRARLVINISDRTGNPLDDVPLSVSCDPGTVSQISGQGKGKYRAIYTAPVRTTGKVACVLEVERGEPTPLRQEFYVELIPPVPAVIEAQTNVYSLPLDGSSGAVIAIRLRDHQGEPLEGVQLRATAPIGTLDQVQEDGQGRYHAAYTAPTGTKSTRVRITVEAGKGEHLISKGVVIILEAPAPPPPPVPRLSIAPWVGIMTNFARIQYATFALEGAVKLPFGADRFYLALEGGFRFGAVENSSSLDGISVKTSLEQFPVHLAVIFKLNPHERRTPWAGIGAGAEFVQWSITSNGGDKERDHQVLPGVFASLGGDWRVGPGALFVTVRYVYAYLTPHGEANRIKGNVGGLDVGLGYRLFY